MKMFRIRVNGHAYEVEVEEIATGARPSPEKAAASRTPQSGHAERPAAQPSAPAPAPAAAASGGAKTILAPMPGTILDVHVRPGEKVTKGQTLMILEAMKMENEILAPADCEVIDTHVDKGAPVNAGDLLVTLA